MSVDHETDLNLLLALDVLIAERSVTRAAERLHLTQSAMSHRLRRLRELFGDQLLVGGRGGLVLTPRAETLTAGLRRGLGELETLLHVRKPFDPAKTDRRFVILTTDYAEIVVASRVLAFLEQHAPHCALELRMADDRVVSRLAEGEADLHVGAPLEAPGIVRTLACEETWAMLLRRDHPYTAPTIDLPTYLSLGHVLVSRDGTPGPVDAILWATGKRRRIALRTPHFAGVPFVVARTDLAATMPAALAREAARYLPLRLLPPPLPMPPLGIYVSWHERMNQDPGHQWLRQIAATLTKEAVAGDPATAPSPTEPRKRSRAR